MKDEVQEFLAHLSVEKGLSQNTIAAYQNDLSRYFEITGEITLNEEALNAFISQERRSGKAESSIAREVVTLRNFAAFMAKEHGRVNRIAEINPPKIPKRLPKALPVATIIQILESFNNPENPIEIRDRAILEILYGSGLRISELTKLNSETFRQTEANKSYKVLGKGGKERFVPIGAPALTAIEDYLTRARPALLKTMSEKALFLNKRGSRISRQSVWEVIQQAAVRAGVKEHLSPHTFRHSFATHLLDGGADIRVVQELLGHSNVTTTQIYTLVTIDKLRESYSTAHPRAK